jgi:hypothetical protein
MANKKTANKTQIFDVSHPGKTAPTTTSKPVIVMNRPVLKDPMMVTSTNEQTESSAPTTPAQKSFDTPKLQPLSAPLLTPAPKKVEVETDDTKPNPPSEPASEVAATSEPITETSTDAAEEPAEPEAPASTPAPEPPKAVEAPAPAAETNAETTDEAEADAADTTTSPSSPAKEEADQAAEAEAYEAAVQKLADSKQYYVPVNSLEKRRTKRFIVLGIIISLILAAAWVDIALDAGLIHIGGLEPVTHLFSN